MARLADLAASPRPRLGAETAITLGIAAFSASSGYAPCSWLSLSFAANPSSLLTFYATALAMTLLGVFAAAVAVAALVVLLPVLPLFGVPPVLVSLLRRSTLAPAALLVCLVVAPLYRYAPAGPPPWRQVLLGAVFATLFRIAALALFSLYVVPRETMAA